MAADQELVRRIAVGDQAAIEEFVTRFQRRVILIAKRRGVPWPDCEDVGQSVVFGAIQQIQKNGFAGEELAPWVFAITSHKVEDHFRNHYRHGSRIDGEVLPDSLSAAGTNQEEDLNISETLESLPELLRNILKRRIEGWSSKEIAAETGLKPQQVDKKALKARRMFIERYFRRKRLIGPTKRKGTGT
jgi:RNA polymerase sigma factor (sigma-70 family)